MEAKMKKLLLVCATLALFATSAYASGVDLAFNACPGGTGATFDAGTQDCTATGPLSTAMYMVFQPADAALDLTAIDVTIDMQVQGDLSSSANFWDFSN